VVRAFLEHRDQLPEDAVHVEGLCFVGGQPSLHTWTETDNDIIEVTIDERWWDVAQYFPIRQRHENELEERYGERLRKDAAITMDLDWDDARVQAVLDVVDRPPGLRRCSE
jgi:hypothetical protein